MIKQNENVKKLGIYLHIPFCAKKCDYCDFLSAPAGREEQKKYVAALKKEIILQAERILEKKNYAVDTVFFGGGTPSLLLAEEIAEIVEVLQNNFQIENDAEITLEANPGTLSENKLRCYKESGINRLSIGLQSAVNQELKELGRIHTFEQFKENYAAARGTGFDNINVDLMNALPGQTLAGWEQTLQQVAALQPEHISAYSLIVEKNTPFYERMEQGKLSLPEEEEERKMYYRTEELLTACGYHRYEISNYAMIGKESRHNLKYWSGEEYLGLGLGAASYLIGETAPYGYRKKNTDTLHLYEESVEKGNLLSMEEQILKKEDAMEEFMFLGLRKMQGVIKRDFLEKFGENVFDIYGEVIEKQKKQGLLLEDGEYLCLTKRGIDISNYVMSEYLF